MEKWRKKAEYSMPISTKIAARHYFIEKGHFLFCLVVKPAVAQGLDQRNKNIFWIKRHNVMHILRDFSLHNLTSYCQGPGRKQANIRKAR